MSPIPLGIFASQDSKIVATGGTITTVGGFKIHTFNSSGTFTVTSGSGTVEYLVVAGGGGGGAQYGGGGGAGGYRSSVVGQNSGGGASAESVLAVTAQGYTVTIGAGGASTSNEQTAAGQGSNSVFSTITSDGGGRGGNAGGASPNPRAGASGGSGGGAGVNSAGGAGTTNQGFTGGLSTNGNSGTAGGAGGGAGGAGQNAVTVSPFIAAAGIGVSSNITGTAVTRAVGGRGAFKPSPAVNGTANFGNGGDGTEAYYPSGSGGSGVVIIRYAA